MMDVNLFLDNKLSEATELLSLDAIPTLNETIRSLIDEIISRSEGAKAVLAVTLTSLVYKQLNPEQDIRKHQSGIDSGYSGRTFDTHYITPFLRKNRFPAMAESGWLTRSLEQKVPYDKDYTGAIRPQSLKDAFLSIIDYIEHSNEASRNTLLIYILCKLMEQRERNVLTLATPQNLSIRQLLTLLERHFSYHYKFEGASRLPSLAIYAIYQILIQEIRRFDGYKLLPLENHTSADRQSGRMGDIDVVDKEGNPFEAVEIKHLIAINREHIEIAYEKFMGTGIKRYYILSTVETSPEELSVIERRINDIKNSHGCQIIVNGVYATLRYYLRLIEDPARFINQYTQLLQEDTTIKYEHREVWNKLVNDILRGE